MMKTIASLAAALAISGSLLAPTGALAGATGRACTVGSSPNCVQSDGDDPTIGTYVNPNDPVTPQSTQGDTGEVTLSPPTNPSPSTPTPPDGSSS